MMLKVLLALDGRAHSKQTLDFAANLLQSTEAEITLFHVIPQRIIYGRAAVVAEAYGLPTERACATELLGECTAYLQTRGIGPTATEGDPEDLILATAEAFDSDLIIVGSHEANAISRFLAGSTASRVSTYAHCPVLVVHPKKARQVECAGTKELARPA